MNVYADMRDYYAELGMQTIPLQSFRRLENGDKEIGFYSDLQWRTSTPTAKQWEQAGGLAVICGKRSGIVALDFDDMSLIPMIEAKIGTRLSCSFQVRTHKGLHCYYAYDERLSESRNLRSYGLEMEIKSNGTLLFAPPTESYSFGIHNKIEPMPEKLMQLLLDIGNDITKSTVEAGAKRLGRRDNWKLVEEGGRNEEMFRSVCSELACGYSAQEVLERAIEWNKQLQKPLPLAELKRSVQSAIALEIRNHPDGRERRSVEQGDGLGFDYWFDPALKRFIVEKCGEIEMFKKDDFSTFLRPQIDSDDKAKRVRTIIDNIPLRYTVFEPVNKAHEWEEKGRVYRNLYMRPPLLDTPAGVKEIPPMINNLLHHLFPEDEMRRHFINWLACYFQTDIKSRTAWVLSGRQGAGKGLLVENVIATIWTKLYTANISQIEVESPFNGWAYQKRFICINEVSADTKQDKVKVKNKIKALVTDPTFQHHIKGVDPVERPNTFNIIIASNETVPVLIEHSDRRFNVVRTGGNIIDEPWYSLKLGDMLIAECEDFASYLAGYPIDMAAYHTAIWNDAKRELLSHSSGQIEDFARALLNCDKDWFLDAGIDKLHAKSPKDLESDVVREVWVRSFFRALDDGLIENADIITAFRQVANLPYTDMGVHKMLTSALESMTSIKVKGSFWVNNKTVRGYKLPRDGKKVEEDSVDEELPFWLR